MKRVVAAFFVAPFAPFLLYLLVNPGSFLAACMVGLPIAYLVTLMWGVPLYFIAKKRPHLQRAYIYALFAGGLGLLAGLIISIFLDAGASTTTILVGAWGLLHGVCSGYVFWLITRMPLSGSAERVSNPPDITALAFFAKLKALAFVEAIYLYGSRARGDHDDWSDIDLAVLCPSAGVTEWDQVVNAVATEEVLVPITAVRYDTLTDTGFKAQIDRDKRELYRRG